MGRNRDYCLIGYLLFDILILLFVILAGGLPVTLTGHTVAAFCEESWSCTVWECMNNTHSERVCTDDNLCSGTANKPAESRQDSSCLLDAGEDVTSGEEMSESPSIEKGNTDEPEESEDRAPIGYVAVQETTSCGESQEGGDSGSCQGGCSGGSGCADSSCNGEGSFAGTAEGEYLPSGWREQRLLDDSPCTHGWPAHQGEVVVINQENYACDLFEVTDSSLHHIAEEAIDCCSSGCGEGCHDFCGSAYKHAGLGDRLAGERLKKCVGLYIIYGLGPARQWMQDYYASEFACAGDLTLSCEEEDRYTCGCSGRSFSENAMSLSCTETAQSWVSDVDMSLNSCYVSDLPAHVNINVLSTGTCVDYSVSLTTLLRIAGYAPDEVYSVMGPGHEYNLVRLPGERMWNVIDTNENNPRPYNPSGLPHQEYSYCDYHLTSCANDAGQGDCPARDMVKGCGE